jgi:hypothetical protein
MLSLRLGRVEVIILTVVGGCASGVGGWPGIADAVVSVRRPVCLVRCVLVILLLLETHKCFVGGASGNISEAGHLA